MQINGTLILLYFKELTTVSKDTKISLILDHITNGSFSFLHTDADNFNAQKRHDPVPEMDNT